MATTTQGSSESTNTEGTEENSEGQSTEENSTSETEGQEESEGQSQDDTSTSTDDKAEKPKPDPAKQSLLADLNKERKDLKAARTKVTELEATVAELTPKAETVDAIQAKYDRLEAFIQGAGGELGKALDSRTFTRDLFESDKDIKDIVKDWRQANPTATSAALGAGAADPAGKGPGMNDILRAAVNG